MSIPIFYSNDKVNYVYKNACCLPSDNLLSHKSDCDDHFKCLAIKWSQAFLTWDCVNSFSHFEQKTTFAAFTNSWLEIWLWSLLTASSSVFPSLSTIRLTASPLSTIDTQTWLTLSFQPAASRTEASIMTTFTPSFQNCWI